MDSLTEDLLRSHIAALEQDMGLLVTSFEELQTKVAEHANSMDAFAHVAEVRKRMIIAHDASREHDRWTP